MSEGKVVCGHAREDCAGCFHSEPHKPRMDPDSDRYCTKSEECVFQGISVNCESCKKEAGHVWCAGWYATKLHAVPVAKHCATKTKYADMRSVCGAHVYKEARTPWAARKIEKGVAKCKHCERMLNT